MRVLTPAVKKPTGFKRRGIRGVENRHAIAEHVADVDMAAVHHDLHAVGAAALIARTTRVGSDGRCRSTESRVRESCDTCEDCAIGPAARTLNSVPAAARPSRPFMCSRRVMDVRRQDFQQRPRLHEGERERRSGMTRVFY